MSQGSESTCRIHSVAISATLLFLLFFGLNAGVSAAAKAPAGPTAPGRASVPETTAVTCAPGNPACDTATAPRAPNPSPTPKPAPTGPASTAPKPGAPTGGVLPDARPPSAGGNQGGQVTPPSEEPAFVEQDPGLSGGVDPDGQTDGSDPLAISPLSVPNFLIDQFEIPPFLLPIFQACGSEYGIPWQVLAAINRIETGFGTNLGVSTAGALGWMQFMPPTWGAYGVDANGDGEKDPFNPVDAICAAANYLQASGYAEDPRGAIFAYNRADWYVDDILDNAAKYAQIPSEVISALTGLTEGARFPIAAESSYEGEIKPGRAREGAVEDQDVSSDGNRTSIEIEAEGGAPVIAVNDSVVTSINSTLGTVVIEDAYGNRYTYAGLGAVATVHPVPRRDERDNEARAPKAPAAAPAPTGAQKMGLAKADDKPDLQAQAETLVDQPRSEVIVGSGSSGNVVEDIANVLFAGGLNETGAAGIIGNAYAESGLNPASTGSGGGGLWGFTVSPVSLADLQEYAAVTGGDWTDAALQTRFLLDHVAGSTLSGVNSAQSPEEAAEIFMVEFERPGIPRLDVRQSAARSVFDSGFTAGGTLELGGSSEVPIAPESAPEPDPATERPIPADPTLTAAEDRRAEQMAINAAAAPTETVNTEDMRGRVYANPLRPQNQNRATVEGVSTELPVSSGASLEGKPGDYVIYDGSASGIYRFDENTTDLKALRKGSRVIAGTVLGRLAEQPTAAITFSIQPGGEDTPQIDPKPFLDGWKLLAASNIYGANGKDRFADRLGVGGVLLLSKSALQRRVLNDPKLSLGECDRADVANGSIDRRVLAMLSFLSEKGYELLITSMLCGREASITTSGYVSNHSSGSAVDIAAINGQVITAATQGPGSLTDIVAREVLSLQGTMVPDEVISLLEYPQTAGFAMSDHDDHLHVGYSPAGDTPVTGGTIAATLGAAQWRKLTERLGQISNPEVATAPSDSSLPVAGSGEGNGN